MDRNEILNEMKMTYKELVAYLLNKYGSAKYDYFRTESCKSKNPKNSRGKEGLDCHHIDEDKAILLANPRHALKNPFAYQKADRLVYCNHLEHFLLHVKIVEEPRNSQANERELPGIGGAVNFLCPQLNDIYNGYVYTREWEIVGANLVKDNFDEYILILQHLWDIIQANEEYSKRISKHLLCIGYDREPIKKISKLLK